MQALIYLEVIASQRDQWLLSVLLFQYQPPGVGEACAVLVGKHD